MSSAKQNITAIIYDRKGRVLSIGKNSYVKTHPLQAKYAKEVGQPYKVHLHAEIAAIVKCKNLRKAYKISVFRYNNQGKPMMAKPCPICMSAIKAAHISVIEWTTDWRNVCRL